MGQPLPREHPVSGLAYRDRVITSRTFVIRVSESPRRVVIDDVRGRRRAMAADLASVGAQIEAWLDSPAVHATADLQPSAREDSVSPSP